LTAAVLSNSPPSAEQPDASLAPAAPVVAAASLGTGVPEASTVFGDKYMPVDEPVPTF
jgi:hypothetical protein